MKTVIMIVACIIVAVCQTFILLGFLKKLKKIEVSFWGSSAERARSELDKAKAEEHKKAAEDEAAETTQ